MPVKYDQDTKAKAIRLVRDHAGDYPTEYAAITAVSRRLGMSAETLRKWIRQAQVDAGQAPGMTSSESAEIRELRRRNRELEQTVEILRAALTEVLAGIYEPGERGRRPPESLYGSLKAHAHLRRQGITSARCTVERLMRANGWRGVTRARKVRTTVPARPTPGRRTW